VRSWSSKKRSSVWLAITWLRLKWLRLKRGHHNNFVSRSFCPGIHSFSIEGYVVWCVNAVARAETEKNGGNSAGEHSTATDSFVGNGRWCGVPGAWLGGLWLSLSMWGGAGVVGVGNEVDSGFPSWLGLSLSLSPRGGPGRLRRRWFPFVLSFRSFRSFRSLRPFAPSVCPCGLWRGGTPAGVPPPRNSTARCAVEFFLPLLQDCCSRALVIDRSTVLSRLPCGKIESIRR